MKLHEIFESIGLTREQIVAVAAGAAVSREPRATVKKSDGRPNCLICGKRINALNCTPILTK